MLISKEKLKEHIDSFEEDSFTVDALIERLIFIEKLEKRIAISESENAKTVSFDANKNTDEKTQLASEIKEAVDNLKLVREGKLEAQPAEDLLNEL